MRLIMMFTRVTRGVAMKGEASRKNCITEESISIFYSILQPSVPSATKNLFTRYCVLGLLELL